MISTSAAGGERGASELLDLLPDPDDESTGIYWVGYSGGADSHALLELAVARYGPGRVRVAHVDHGLHPDSGLWAGHCRAQATRLGVGFEQTRLVPPSPDGGNSPTPNIEAWAREERYRYWRGLLGCTDRLLLAHHRDDQIETVALRLSQGRLPRPMPRCRALGLGRVVRPLLGVSRAELRDYLKTRSSQWIEDPSNADERFLRNRVRHQLLPQINARLTPAWSGEILRCGVLTNRLLASLAERLGSHGLEGDKAAGMLVQLPLAGLGEQGLLSLLHQCGVVQLRARQMREAVRRLDGGAQQPMGLIDKRGARVELWSCSQDDQRGLVLWRVPALPSQPAPVLPSQPAHSLPSQPAQSDWVVVADSQPLEFTPRQEFAHGRLRIHGAGSADELDGVRARFPVAGDRLKRAAGEARLTELLREARVPRWERASLPVLVDGAGVLCVPGIGRRPDCAFEASWSKL